MRSSRLVVALAVAGAVLGACGDDGGGSSAEDGRPSIVVTTNILGDVVSSLVGDAAEVTVVMPPGSSPHDFQASARDAQAMREADLLVVNGAGFEEGLGDVIDGAEADGAVVHEAIGSVEALTLGDGQGVDPHFFTDPARMAVAARGILDAATAEVPALDTDEVRAGGDAYIAELESLDAEVEAILAPVPDVNRVLVTNHEVFAYLADRYGFDVVGTVIPGGGTGDSASAAELAALAVVIDESGVPAIFADTSSPIDLAETLADEVGDIDVVVLFSESLGEPGSGGETYIDMVRTNAQRISGALAGAG